MKKLVSVFVLLLLSLGLVGCQTQPMQLHFEGKVLSETQIEEIIEDRLEEENGIELEVNIYEEVED